MSVDSPQAFAKLFDTIEGQLLITLVETDDEEPDLEIRAASIDGVTAKMTLAFDTEEEQQNAFNSFDQSGAEEASRSLRNAVRGLLTN